MLLIIWTIWTSLVLGAHLIAAQQPGYLVSAPNRFIPNRPETVCIDLYNVADVTAIEVSLITVWIDTPWQPLPEGTQNSTLNRATTTMQPGDETKCLSLTMPKFESETSPEYVTLEVSGRPATRNPAGYSFQDTMNIAIISRWYNTDITFIQTDKPIYKPGQLVRIRILSLDTQLRPSTEVIESVSIQAPSKVRVEQWNNLIPANGMVQLEFQLHEEPDMGVYKIKMKRNGEESRQRFEVKEYVLPKYEVTLDPPKYVTFQTERVVAKVCAKYTFGQPVLGLVEASVCIKEPRQTRIRLSSIDFEAFSEADENTGIEGYCTLVVEPLLDGCYSVNVSREDVGYSRYRRFKYGVKLIIEARVREQGTGAYLNATSQVLTFQEYDVNLEMEGSDKFKPGLPYNAKVITKMLDGKPAPGEPVDIVINNWGSRGKYSKSYVADANGEVKFSIPPAAQDLSSYSIQAVATRFNSSFWRWSSPRAYLYVEGWYSPSGSFLQIVPNTQTLSCGSQATFKIQYTTSIALETPLQYKVVGLTDIADYGSSPISLTLNTAVTEQDEQDDWDHTPRDSCYYYWWRSCDAIIDSVTSESPGRDTTTTVAPPTTTQGAQVTATHKGTFSITVQVTAAMSTSGKLVVYYIRPDGEVVADGLTFKVEECTENEAQMRFSKSEARPGEPVDLLFTASPNSLCSYGVVDKSVFLEGGDNQLSLSKALSKIKNLALQEWSGVYWSDFSQCGSLPSNDTHSFYWSMPYEDANDGFRAAGLVTATSLNISTSPCILNSYRLFNRRFESSDFASESDDLVQAFGGGGFGGGGGGGGQSAGSRRKTAASVQESSRYSSIATDELNSERKDITKTVRTYFPETWLWDMVDVGSTGAATVASTVPDTITEWVGNTVCMDEQDGLGVSPAASLIAFQPFFVSMNLPYSVIRREKMPIAVTVSNYLSQCLAVALSINESTDYEILQKSSAVRCVCSQGTATKKFTIVINQIGSVNISINAEVVNNPSVCPSGSEMATLVGMSDTVIRPVIVEPEGTPREYTVSDFVCMTDPDSGESAREAFLEIRYSSTTIVVSATPSGTTIETYSLPLPNPAELIAGSERAYVKVVGDVMGPAMSNIGSLLRMPYGCAEQTMVSFAPNIFALKYLEAVNKDNPAIRKRAIQYMKSGYQRELTYAHADQSYSSFGKSKPDTPGSMWLTAFVVKCFGLAEPYIYIDQTIQSKSIDFFIRNQDRDGCYPQIGTTHNKYMQGGFGATSNGTNKAAMTAYVAIAMMEAGVETTSPSLGLAFECIDRQLYEDGYTISLVAYAYSLFNKADDRAFRKLLSMAKVNGTMTMWKANENEPEPPRIHWWYYRPSSADTETTAYALLTLLKMRNSVNEKIQDGLPIVRWLSTQRNPWGGFGSTQDTVIGLQALAEYAALIYIDGISASIRITEKNTNTQVASFQLNNDNSFVEFTERLPRVADLRLTATGKGCFLMQTNVRYNINQPDKKRQPFTTTARVYRKRGSKEACKHRQLRVCTRYTGEGGVSNMAIVQAKMVSGWAANKAALKDLMKDESVDLQRYEVDRDGTVQLYFNSLNSNQKCFTIDINQEFNVKNVKPAVVTTYDYYKTELRQETQYKIYKCSPLTSPSTEPAVISS
ncbi:ovostatin-like [Watersipora subatra]|uniref:ovostatin-like n=1 Tax=Watersipora subatra TaxID=2589382 RepID=UPI00355C42A3